MVRRRCRQRAEPDDKEKAIRMKNQTLSDRSSVPVIAFLQVLEASSDACSTREGAAMWLFKRFIDSPMKSVIKAVGDVNKPICKSISQWWSKHQLASLENLAKKAKSCANLWISGLCANNRSDSE